MKKTGGFSIAEIAIVLVIVGLVLGGLMVPLGVQMEQRRVSETQAALDQIKEALIGYAIANGRLPRPATSFANGTENPTPCGTGSLREGACTGFIPWATLGVPKLDAWGKLINYSVTPAMADGPISLASVGTKTIHTRDSAGNLVMLAGQASCTAATPCMPVVIYSSGKNNLGASETGSNIPNGSAGSTNVDEQNNDAKRTTPTPGAAQTDFVSRPITPGSGSAVGGGEFDDIVTWIPLNTLFNRMVTAQKLP